MHLQTEKTMCWENYFEIQKKIVLDVDINLHSIQNKLSMKISLSFEMN
jgi:hypothetical protein